MIFFLLIRLHIDDVAALISFAQKQDIHVTAFSPFGAPERPWATEKTPNLLKDEKVLAVRDCVSSVVRVSGLSSV